MIETTPLRRKLLDLAISGKLVPKTGEWKMVKLGDVVDVLDSLRKPITKKNRKPGNIPYYGATCVQDFVDGYIFDETLVLLGEDGAKWGAGDCSAYLIHGKSWVNNHAHVLRVHGDVLNEWLVSYLTYANLEDYITGTTVPKLNQERMRQIDISLPPLGEQKAIVKRLEELLALEREIATESAALDDLITAAKRKILDLAMSGKLSAECGVQSAEWKTVKLGDIAQIARGGSPRPIKAYLTESPEGLNWIKIGDADGSKYITSVKEKILPSGLKKTRQVYAGDLLLTNSMSFGHPYILKVDGCIHDGWLVLHTSDGIDKEFLYYVLTASRTMDQFRMAASGGVVSNLNSDKVAATEVPLPPLAEQKAIVKRVEELFAVLDAMKEA